MLLIVGTVGWHPDVVCQPQFLSQCRSLSYSTTLPNLRGQTTPSVIENELLQFKILFHYNCSNALLVFLCAIHAPFCALNGSNRPAVFKLCRNLCTHVYNDCIGVFNEFQHQWPEMLLCENFPERSEEWCFGPADPSDIEYPTLVSPNATIPLPTSPKAITSMPILQIPLYHLLQM